MTLSERVVALHQALDRGRFPHAFGGAIALAYWTLDPRGTSDIDINVFLPASECRAVLATLPEGVAQPEGTIAQIERDGQIRLWWEGTPVDLFFDNLPIHGDAARHSRTVPFPGSEIPVLGPVELAVFKAMFDRTKDWADIEAMIAASTLDLDAVRAALTTLVGTDDARLARLDDATHRASTG